MPRVSRLLLIPLSIAMLAVALAAGSMVAQDSSPAPMHGGEATDSMDHMDDGLIVRDAWTRASMMIELANAAYMTIHNSTDADDALVAASSSAARVVEIHQTSTDEDGAMSMAPVADVPIPAHGDAVFEPGGYHLMLIDLVEMVEMGNAIQVTLEFAHADSQTIDFPVLATGPMSDTGPMSHTEMHDEMHDEMVEPELTWAPLVTLPPLAEPPISTPLEFADGFALGSPDAPVTVEVWEDFQCPFCQRFTFQVEPGIVDQYVRSGQVRFVFRNLAFLGDESHWAAVAASLAADQDRFWPFHDYLFANLQGENVGSFSLDRLLAIGEASGLDMAEFKRGLTLDKARERFAQIQQEALRDAGSLGINATPTVTVDGTPLQAPDLGTISAAIEAALASAAAEEAPEEATTDG